MDNNELLEKVIAAMQQQSETTKKDIMEQVVTVVQEQKKDIMEQVVAVAQEQKKAIMEQVVAVAQEQTETLTKMVQDVETRVNLKIENEVSRKIEALFDGYKLAHDQQWELQRRVDSLERRLEKLEAEAM